MGVGEKTYLCRGGLRMRLWGWRSDVMKREKLVLLGEDEWWDYVGDKE